MLQSYRTSELNADGSSRQAKNAVYGGLGATQMNRNAIPGVPEP
jgi:hypothetical protein